MASPTSHKTNRPDTPDPVDEQLINTDITFLPEESSNAGSLDARESDVIPNLGRCSGGKFQSAWTVPPGTGADCDMCCTPEGLLAVVRANFNIKLMLYEYYGTGQYGHVVNISRVTLDRPTGIAYYPPERALAVIDYGQNS